MCQLKELPEEVHGRGIFVFERGDLTQFSS